MSNMYPQYLSAEQRLENRWIKMEWSDSMGGVCLVQSYTEAMGLSDFEQLPEPVIRDMERQLRKYPFYWWAWGLTWFVCFWKSRNIRRMYKIAHWNDAPWRRKTSVLKIAAKLAASQELDWLRAEHQRLLSVYHQQEAMIANLKERIAQLDKENRGLRRLTRSYALRSDRQQLATLEDELSAMWNDLTSVENRLSA